MDTITTMTLANRTALYGLIRAWKSACYEVLALQGMAYPRETVEARLAKEGTYRRAIEGYTTVEKAEKWYNNLSLEDDFYYSYLLEEMTAADLIDD